MPQEFLAVTSASRPKNFCGAYRLSSPDMNHRLRCLLADRSYRSWTQFGCYLLHGNHPYSDIARNIEGQVFDEFFGNGPSLMAHAYGAYEAHSLFFSIVDIDAQIAVGTLRVIQHSQAGLKTLSGEILQTVEPHVWQLINGDGLPQLAVVN